MPCISPDFRAFQNCPGNSTAHETAHAERPEATNVRRGLALTSLAVTFTEQGPYVPPEALRLALEIVPSATATLSFRRPRAMQANNNFGQWRRLLY